MLNSGRVPMHLAFRRSSIATPCLARIPISCLQQPDSRRALHVTSQLGKEEDATLFNQTPEVNQLTGSAKLFADAAAEKHDGPSKSPKLIRLESQQDANWDGDERMEDTILRMLMDKYKPLRSGTIRTADEKLRDQLSSPRSSPLHVRTVDMQTVTPTIKPVPSVPVSDPDKWADQPLLPAVEGHRPWHTTYTMPAQMTSIRLGNIPQYARPLSQISPSDDRERRKLAAETRKAQYANRLTKAKEGTLDYRLGVKHGNFSASQDGQRKVMRANPVSMRGWNSMIEDKIEKARLSGAFNAIKGRGQPLPNSVEESNPFIGREEFLMNRIVLRNGASPPWIDVQEELESAIDSFRGVLRQSWTRRALRTLTTAHTPASLLKLNLDDIASLRDKEWEDKESAYHDKALDEINKLVRKYNGVAPYAVRRGYYERQKELVRAYQESCGDIHRSLKERKLSAGSNLFRAADDTERVCRTSGHADTKSMRLRDVFRAWIKRWFHGVKFN